MRFVSLRSNGIMILLARPLEDKLPMIFIDVQTGKPLQNVAYEGDLSQMEFFEQFNDYLLIKPLNRPLQIYNVIKQKKVVV